MAYASLAGLPVEVGLYVAIVPMVAYALVGSSRPLSVSSTSTISILTAGALVEAGADGDPGRAVATASLLAVLVGGFLAAAGLLRLGFLADFISSPVLAGFKAGMGLYIAASQLGKVLGVPVEGDSFFAKLWSALDPLGDANPATVALALGGLASCWPFTAGPRTCPARWSWWSSGSPWWPRPTWRAAGSRWSGR